MSLMSRFEVYCRKRIAQRLSRKPASRVSPLPIVSFTFDDFPRSAFTVAGAMLMESGLRGTYYASMGLMGQQTIRGENCRAADLQTLVEQGHELGCHTFSHLYCLRATASEVRRECEQNRLAAADVLGGYRLRNFSFPSGVATRTTKSELASTYDSCRTVEHGINRSPVDLAFLRANPLYSRNPISDVHRLIAENAKQAGWLILYTHDVSPQPSEVGCTPSYFRDTLGSAVASGARIMTVAEAVSQFQLQADRG